MNFANRTIWTADNLDIMRGLNSESVDLIYLDPPFNSNREYSAPAGSVAAGAAFKDTWTLSDLDVAWMGLIAEEHPALYKVIEASGMTSNASMQSYLCMMAVRLLEMRRVLKDTGSIYLHCDDTAGHYLKLLMDSVFGGNRFRNNIVWRRATAHNDSRRFGRNLDYILFYTKGDKWTWNATDILVPKSPEDLEKAYPQSDDRGAFRAGDITGPLHGTSPGLPSTTPWKGYDVYANGRCWSPPKTGAYALYIEENFIPDYRSIQGVHERLDALDDAGLIRHPKRGKWPGLKRYADADRGNLPQSLILTPTGFTNYTSGKEYIGSPTQKPLGLLEPLIKASSNRGDVVLDPFCGCASACVAAEKLDRQWVGIDLSPKTLAHVRHRLASEVRVGSDDHPRLTGWNVTHRTDIPRRTDIDAPKNYRKNKHVLFGKQEGQCGGCRMEFPFKVLEVDHLIPRARGGTDHLENLQLLCSHCNRIKGDRSQAYLIARLKELGIL